jgi:hypothetical protein
MVERTLAMEITDPICKICNEPRSKHVQTEEGTLTHPREALGEGKYVLASVGTLGGGVAGPDIAYERYVFVPAPTPDSAVEWFYADDRDAERWNGPETRENAIGEGREAAQASEAEAFYIARGSLPSVSDIVRHTDAEDLLERMSDYAADNDMTDPEGDGLQFKDPKRAQTELEEWAARNLEPTTWWNIDNSTVEEVPTVPVPE